MYDEKLDAAASPTPTSLEAPPQPRRAFLLSLAGMTVAVALTGCGSGGTSPSLGGGTGNGSGGNRSSTGTGRVQFTIFWPARSTKENRVHGRYIPVYANSIVLAVVSGDGKSFVNTMVANRPGDTASTQTYPLNFDLPVGNYTVTANACVSSNGGGAVIASAVANIEVTDGQTVTPSLSLASTVATLSITNQPLYLPVGGTMTLTAQAKDAGGNVLLLPTGALTWKLVSAGTTASGGDTMATITSAGVLTASAVGTARVEVQETGAGVSASTTVTVYAPTATGLAASSWPIVGGNAQGSFRASGVAPAKSAAGAGLWSFTAGDTVSNPVIGPDKTIYVTAGATRKVYALDGATGVKKWEFTAGGPLATAVTVSANGMVYVGAENNTIYALDAGTGRIRWTFSPDAKGGGVRLSVPGFSLALSPDGILFVPTYLGLLYGVDAQTGAQRWSINLVGNIYSQPTLSPDGKILYATSHAPVLIAIDTKTGQYLWQYPGWEYRAAHPTVGPDGNLYFDLALSDDPQVSLFLGGFYVRDGTNGSVKQKPFTSSEFTEPICLGADLTAYLTDAESYTAPDDPDTPLYKYYLKAFKTQSGYASKWTTLLNGIPQGISLGLDNIVYVAMTDRLSAFDAATGAVKWELTTGGLAVANSPALGDNGIVYIGVGPNVWAIH